MVIFWAQCCIILFSLKKNRVALESRTLVWVPLLQAKTLNQIHPALLPFPNLFYNLCFYILYPLYSSCMTYWYFTTSTIFEEGNLFWWLGYRVIFTISKTCRPYLKALRALFRPIKVPTEKRGRMKGKLNINIKWMDNLFNQLICSNKALLIESKGGKHVIDVKNESW